MSGCPPSPCSLQAVASAAQASLLRQQEELDRKAAELERKEQELQNTVTNLHGEGARSPGAPEPQRRTVLSAGELHRPACPWGGLPAWMGS